MKRSLLVTICLLFFVGSALAKDTAANQVAASMADAATNFLASLDAGQRAKATMKFDDPARLDWHNIPKAERKGLQVRDMTTAQRKLCHALLQTALSDVGYQKAVNIMALENNLREGEKSLKNGPLRDPDRYFLTIFGTPGNSGEWGWSFEGHHFSLNFAFCDGHVISDTPSFWGANPATVKNFIPGGPEVGTRTLAQEEELALDLVNALDDSQRKKAVVAEAAPKDYRAAGKPQPPQTAPEGLPAAEMTADQKNILRSLLDVYCKNLALEIAKARLAAIDEAGFDKIYFGWSGATSPGIGHAYRIQGPTFVLELVNIQSDPSGNPANHIHSVWRSMKGDFGVAAAK
jgi:prepilin-type processing-associated H-X9-DG protein